MRRAVHIGAREDATIVRGAAALVDAPVRGLELVPAKALELSPDGPPSALVAGESA